MKRSFVRQAVLIVVICMAWLLGQAWGGAEKTPPPATEHTSTPAGKLAACNLFSSFACVGLTADGYEAGLYKPADVQDYMNDLEKVLSVSIETLDGLGPAGTKQAETVTTGEMIEAYRSLQTEAKLLCAYADAPTGEKKVADRKAYRAGRDASWKRISTVLGIDSSEARR